MALVNGLSTQALSYPGSVHAHACHVILVYGLTTKQTEQLCKDAETRTSHATRIKIQQGKNHNANTYMLGGTDGRGTQVRTLRRFAIGESPQSLRE